MAEEAAVVEATVAVTDFIARADSTKEVLKSANLLKTLNVNVVVEGDKGTGKLTLARYILPHAKVFHGSMIKDIETYAADASSGIIIKDFHAIDNFSAFYAWYEENPVRIIATSQQGLSDSTLDKFFSTRLYLTPLSERHEDIQPLAKKFLAEAQQILGTGMEEDIKPDRLILDVKENCHSLRRSIFFTFLMDNIGENEIMIMMENYLMNRIGGNNDYRDFLYLYEAPLIRASLKQFKSQLQIADRLGLNRNTLRKKISELKDLL